MPSYDVALVYAGPDLPIVDYIAQALKRSGLRVWFDRLLKPDEVFSAEMVVRVFSNSRFVVPLMSMHAERSSWVNAELQLAFRMDARVLPCIIGEVGYERQMDAAVLQKLHSLSFFDLRSGGENISDERLRKLADLLLRDEPSATSHEPMRRASGARLIWPTLALLAAGVLFASLRGGASSPTTRDVDLRPSLALAAGTLVSLGAFICVVAVLLWGLRNLLETLAARRVWRRIRSTLSGPTDSR